MPPRTRSNNSPKTRKRQPSNVDETANKRPKTDNNEIGEDDKKRKAKKLPKSKGERYVISLFIKCNADWYYVTGSYVLPKVDSVRRAPMKGEFRFFSHHLTNFLPSARWSVSSKGAALVLLPWNVRIPSLVTRLPHQFLQPPTDFI
jgi:hypothetical protein